MNPYECQRSRSFSDFGSRSLGLNVKKKTKKNFKNLLQNPKSDDLETWQTAKGIRALQTFYK